MESIKQDNFDQISIYYEKNPLYRTIYVDGVIGGLTPVNNGVNLSFFATRRAIPKAEYYKLVDGLTEENIGQSKDSKQGLIREIEMGVYMTKDTAKEIYVFLKDLFENEQK